MASVIVSAQTLPELAGSSDDVQRGAATKAPSFEPSQAIQKKTSSNTNTSRNGSLIGCSLRDCREDMQSALSILYTMLYLASPPSASVEISSGCIRDGSTDLGSVRPPSAVILWREACQGVLSSLSNDGQFSITCTVFGRKRRPSGRLERLDQSPEGGDNCACHLSSRRFSVSRENSLAVSRKKLSPVILYNILSCLI